MASYNPEEFTKMQREALARLHEMQRRSKSIVSQAADPQQNSSHSQNPAGRFPPNGSGGQQRQNSRPPDGITGLIKSFVGELDADRVLILMMLLILYKNKADIKLLLALGYLLM